MANIFILFMGPTRLSPKGIWRSPNIDVDGVIIRVEILRHGVSLDK